MATVTYAPVIACQCVEPVFQKNCLNVRQHERDVSLLFQKISHRPIPPGQMAQFGS